MAAFTASNGTLNYFNQYSGGGISMCIYAITNTLNGKIYIGQTRNIAVKRWQNHCTPSNKSKSGIVGAIRKHGKSVFTFDVIDTAETLEQLNHKEIFWIQHFNSVTPNGYNLDRGGNEKKVVSDLAKHRMKVARNNWLERTPDRSSLGNGARGRKRSAAEVETIKRNLTGRHCSPETREKMSRSQKGVPKSPDFVLRMARSRMNGKLLLRSDGIVFQSYYEAAKAVGISAPAIHNAANGRTKKSGGFTWELIEQE